MDTQALAAFVEVAESQSFSKAADRLHLSQPAVSKRIAALESELNTPLFDRIGRQIRLTDAGLTLLPYAKRVHEDIEDGKRALATLHDSVRGRLSIGTSHHIGLHRLPEPLKRYTFTYPQVDLDLHFMDSEVACEQVLAGKLELGVVTLPTHAMPGLVRHLVWHDPLVVVVARNHVLAASTSGHPLRELAAHAAVLPDEATYTHRIIKAALNQHGLAPRIRLATNYLETLKMLVAIGLGWSVLPRSMLDDSLVVVPVPELDITRELGVVWHERRTLSTAARALIKQLIPVDTL